MDEPVVQKTSPKTGYLAYVFVAVIFLCIGIFVGVLIAGYSDGNPKADVVPLQPIGEDVIVPKEDGVMCTTDAKLCPDGSAVGRMPPNCEFAPCPDGTNTETAPEPTIVQEGISIEGGAGWGSVDPSGLDGR